MKTYLYLAAAVIVGGGLIWLIQHERNVGALNAALAIERDSVKHERDSVAADAKVAKSAANKAEIERQKALALVARQRADSARQDSLVRASANARAQAEQVARDSSASAQALRAALENVLAASRRDSAQYAADRQASTRTVSGLTAALAAADSALAAEQHHSAALTALAASLTAELKQVKAQSPSPFGQAVKLALTGL